MRSINQAGLDLIKRYEGLRLTAYRDAVGVVTIGYGHIKTAKLGMTITDGQAEDLLKQDLIDAENAVSKLVRIDLDDDEFAALVSFVFNLGEGNLARSTLLKKLNNSDRFGAASEFSNWNKAGGKVLSGLTKRRNAERQLFLGIY